MRIGYARRVPAVAIIPARYGSTRFPGKVLAPIAGRPMIEWVWRAVGRARALERVIVATEDERVATACRSFGAEVVLTRADHPSGSDRLAEVAAGLDAECIVNVQGDEPLMAEFVIDAAVAALERDPEAVMSTVAHEAEPEALDDPNRVKVVLDRHGRALYFSRSAIPARRADGVPAPVLQHIGLYVYRRSFLLEYVTLEPTPAERSEGLEQLRVLENGYAIACAVVDGWTSAPVDVPADLARVEARLRHTRNHPDEENSR